MTISQEKPNRLLYYYGTLFNHQTKWTQAATAWSYLEALDETLKFFFFVEFAFEKHVPFNGLVHPVIIVYEGLYLKQQSYKYFLSMPTKKR